MGLSSNGLAKIVESVHDHNINVKKIAKKWGKITLKFDKNTQGLWQSIEMREKNLYRIMCRWAITSS
jgi:hypothetical protein